MRSSEKWDLRFMRLARHVSSWSKDPSTRCGAVIVDRERRVLALGYNGFPRGVVDHRGRLQDRETKLRFTVHAEVNAVLNATGDVRGATIYVWPLFTCCDCAKVIIQSGIRRVVCGEVVERFRESNEAARQMFWEADIDLVEMTDVGEADPQDRAPGPEAVGRHPG